MKIVTPVDTAFLVSLRAEIERTIQTGAPAHPELVPEKAGESTAKIAAAKGEGFLCLTDLLLADATFDVSAWLIEQAGLRIGRVMKTHGIPASAVTSAELHRWTQKGEPGISFFNVIATVSLLTI